MSAAVAELLSGRLFAVGDCVPASRPTTWIMPGLDGKLAVPCFVLKDSDTALLIDTGLAVHRRQIAQGLASVLDGPKVRSLIMTRREPDCIINLPWLIAEFGIDPVFCGGVLSPLDFFERFEQKAAEAHVQAIPRTGVTWLHPGATATVGNFRVQVLRAKLSVLPKSHLYEFATRTLFGSDTWGYLTQPDPGAPAVIRAIDDRLSRAHISAYLRHKFDWLLGIDTKPVEEELSELLEGYEIDRICPSYGCVIEGRNPVRHLLSETIAAVRTLSSEPPADRLRGFSRELFEGALERAARP